MNKEEKVAKFFYKNREKIKNPLIQGFLSDKYNFSLLERYIMDPSDVNKNIVDEAFKVHYTRVVKIKYVSNLIHFFSIDFNKKRRKENETVLLILDKNSKNDERTVIKDLIQDDIQRYRECNLNCVSRKAYGFYLPV